MRGVFPTRQHTRAVDALKLERLRLSIQEGAAAFERGDFTEIEDADLDAALDDLVAPEAG